MLLRYTAYAHGFIVFPKHTDTTSWTLTTVQILRITNGRSALNSRKLQHGVSVCAQYVYITQQNSFNIHSIVHDKNKSKYCLLHYVYNPVSTLHLLPLLGTNIFHLFQFIFFSPRPRGWWACNFFHSQFLYFLGVSSSLNFVHTVSSWSFPRATPD